MTVRNALKHASERFQATGIETPMREARLLLSLQEGFTIARQLSQPDRLLDKASLNSFFSHVARRAEGESFAYIAGYALFFGRHFTVGPGILVPRPETEQLTEWWLHHIVDHFLPRLVSDKRQASICLVDLCCGSGCIGLTLGLELEKYGLDVDALYLADISATALDYAHLNASALAPHMPVQLVQADLFVSPWPDADIVLCNPPYIDLAKDNGLAADVRRFEPHLALDGGQDGLTFYHRLAKGLADRIGPNTMVGVEHGFEQADAVKKIFNLHQFDVDASLTDYMGYERGQRLYRERLNVANEEEDKV